MFSAFWEQAYQSLFEGATILTPLIHPQTDTAVFPILGRILSHGFLVTGFLPIRIALPTLIGILLGPAVPVPPDVIRETFLVYLSSVERSVFREALRCGVFTQEMQSVLLNTVSRFGCRQMPTPANLTQLLQQIVQYEFCTKPTAAVAAIHAGIPTSHTLFWRNKSVEFVQSLYKSLTVTATRVLGILHIPECRIPAEQRIHRYYT